MKNYDLFEKVRFCLGDKILLNNIALALNVEKFNEIIEYIARMNDISKDEGEDEDECAKME